MHAPAVLCLSAVAILLVAEYRGRARLKAAAKLTASTAFLWAALSVGALETGYGRVLLVAFAASWIGDALLLPPGTTRWFRLGIAAFLLAHIAYTAAFIQLPIHTAPAVVATLIAVAVGVSVSRWLRPMVPAPFDRPVLAYIAAIAVMLGAALAVSGSGAPGLLGLGAVLFVVSDLFVARNRFVAPGFVNRAVGLPLYYLAQLMLAHTPALVAPA